MTISKVYLIGTHLKDPKASSTINRIRGIKCIWKNKNSDNDVMMQRFPNTNCDDTNNDEKN